MKPSAVLASMVSSAVSLSVWPTRTPPLFFSTSSSRLIVHLLPTGGSNFGSTQPSAAAELGKSPANNRIGTARSARRRQTKDIEIIPRLQPAAEPTQTSLTLNGRGGSACQRMRPQVGSGG